MLDPHCKHLLPVSNVVPETIKRGLFLQSLSFTQGLERIKRFQWTDILTTHVRERVGEITNLAIADFYRPLNGLVQLELTFCCSHIEKKMPKLVHTYICDLELMFE